MLNLHIYPSNMENESRIFRITGALVEAGLVDEVILVGKKDSGMDEYSRIDEHRRIWRVPLSRLSWLHWKIRKVVKYLQWLWKIYHQYGKERVGMINCHSLYDLPVGVALKRATGCWLVYDTHELETERNGLKGVLKRIMKVMERRYIKKVDQTFVVGESIARWYRETYGIESVSVVKNIPPTRAVFQGGTVKLREKYHVPAGRLLYIYQGGFFKGRGISLLLKVFSREDIQDHIVFMGFGEYLEEIEAYCQEYSNIHYHPAVSPDRVVEYTSSVDIGFSLIEDTCLSYYYSLPNKVFEYLVSGIPGIVSDFPDMRQFVDQYGCGWAVPVNEESVYSLVKKISGHPGPLIAEKRQNIFSLLNNQTFGWETEKQNLVKVYNEKFLEVQEPFY